MWLFFFPFTSLSWELHIILSRFPMCTCQRLIWTHFIPSLFPLQMPTLGHFSWLFLVLEHSWENGLKWPWGYTQGTHDVQKMGKVKLCLGSTNCCPENALSAFYFYNKDNTGYGTTCSPLFCFDISFTYLENSLLVVGLHESKGSHGLYFLMSACT